MVSRSSQFIAVAHPVSTLVRLGLFKENKTSSAHGSRQCDQLAAEAVAEALGPLADEDVSCELGDITQRDRRERMLDPNRETELSIMRFHVLLV